MPLFRDSEVEESVCTYTLSAANATHTGRSILALPEKKILSFLKKYYNSHIQIDQSTHQFYTYNNLLQIGFPKKNDSEQHMHVVVLSAIDGGETHIEYLDDILHEITPQAQWYRVEKSWSNHRFRFSLKDPKSRGFMRSAFE